VLLALARASSGVRKVSTVSTGPKISSRDTRIDALAAVITVGRKYQPRSGSGQDADHTSAPSSRPAWVRVVIRSSWRAELIAPTSVFLSIGSPTRRVSTRDRSLASSSSAIDSWTSSREPAQQTWPALKKMPFTMPSTAWSRAASAKTMFAPLPPSSRVILRPVPARLCWMERPTAVEPVNATLSRPGWLTSVEPTSPAPGTTLTTPGGRSASAITSASTSSDSGVVSAGLITTVLPAARAGAIFQAAISSGKFQGITWPATPSGRGSAPRPRCCSLSAQPAW
jgi:hypothetical protein